ncbi:MAG: hypothetical protein NC117_06980 [Pseudoflavonifractor sp.]|nr:hypothetical protein [Pseudoflavonifractor sp.]
MLSKDRLRPQEEIISELADTLRQLDEEQFIVHVMSVLCSLEYREDKLFDNLDSPMKQMLYLIDLYYSIDDHKPKHHIDERRWSRITELLAEIEMNYFISIGFSNGGDYFHDNRDDKVAVSLMTYLNHFSNAQLSYDEQTLWRLENYCRPYDDEIEKQFGFRIADVITYLHHLRELYNGKLNDMVQRAGRLFSHYHNNPDDWKRQTERWIEAGIEPDRWIEQPELSELATFMQTSPGECFIHDVDAIKCSSISVDVNERLIEFLRYRPETLKMDGIYYGSERQYSRTPLIFIGQHVAVPHTKFLVEAFYQGIDGYLSRHESIGVSYKQSKDRRLEGKTLDVFRKLFGREAHYYNSYSVDGRSEQDLLIEYKGVYLIIEIKDCNFREPMREPLRAYNKILHDFKSAIQKGYEQCVRVEDALDSGREVEISDGKKFKDILYRIKPGRVNEIYSIVVTQHKYGPIQTDLSGLLQIDDNRPYPWSVCIDDLETFVLLLTKIFHKGAASRFIRYLSLRESLHSHLICFDELELCGYYVCQPMEFKRLADMDTPVHTFPGMSDIFDAYYHVGLGFDNELDADIKRQYQLPDYARQFDITQVGLNDILNFQDKNMSSLV